jgi:hypothetical protein
MKMTRDNFGDLLTPIHRKIFFEAYTEKAPQYPQLFNTKDSMRKYQETFPHMGAFGMWDLNSEGNTINEDAMSEGDTATFTALRYDKGYSVTWELVRDDLYNVMKGMGKRGSATALGKGIRVRIETLCADVINDGFATTTGYDGVYLFSNSHPLADSASLGDNLITGAISDTTVKSAMTQPRDCVDEANLKVAARGNIVWAASNKEWDVYTILGSDKVAGVADNDKNVLTGIRPVIMDYLTDNYWGVADSNFENLKFMWRDQPIFDSQPLSKTVDYFMYGAARCAAGYVDWRGLVGSTG